MCFLFLLKHVHTTHLLHISADCDTHITASMAAATLAQRICNASPALEDIMRRFTPDAPIVQLRDEARKLLLEHKIMEYRRCSTASVGVYPFNRFNEAIIPSHVIELIDGIVGEGYSEEAMDVRYALAMPPPGTSKNALYAAENEKLIVDAGGVLPPYELGASGLQILSASCGHTAQGFRCFLQAGPSDHPKLSENGKWSLHKLRQLQPKYATAVEEGLDWFVVPAELEDCFPRIMELFMEAGNLPAALATTETRYQIVLKLHAAAQRHFKIPSGDSADEVWERVKLEAFRGRPSFKDEIGDFIIFLKNLSGGLDNPIHLDWITSFLRTLQNPRIVRGECFAAVATTPIGTMHACPEFRVAMLMSMLSASSKYSGPGNEQTLFGPSEISRVSSPQLKVHAMAANAMMVKGKELLEQHAGTKPLAIWALHIFWIRLVHHVMRKPDESRGSFKSLDDIGTEYVANLAAAAGASIASPWQSAGSSNASDQDTRSKTHHGFVKYETSGDVANASELLSGMGFICGATVRHKKSNEKFKITIVGAAEVTLSDALQGVLTVQHAAFLNGEYAIAIADECEQVLQDYRKSYCPTINFAMKCDLVASRLKLGLMDLLLEHISVLDGLEIITHPKNSKGVRATQKFSTGSLILVPMTMNVDFKPITASVGYGVCTGMELTNEHKDKQFKVYLLISHGISKDILDILGHSDII